MIKTLLICTAYLYNCTTVPVYKEAANPYTINKNIDSVWTKLLIYAYDGNNKLKVKDKADGVMTIEVGDFPITYLDKGTLKDPAAFAIVDVVQKVGNGEYRYPKTAMVECTFILIKINDNTTQLIIKLKDKCTVTSYYRNTFLINKQIKNVSITYTGKYEPELLNQLNLN